MKIYYDSNGFSVYPDQFSDKVYLKSLLDRNSIRTVTQIPRYDGITKLDAHQDPTAWIGIKVVFSDLSDLDDDGDNQEETV